jgi:tRNA nucleotidyltransferase (CCA-adding enzyme)
MPTIRNLTLPPPEPTSKALHDSAAQKLRHYQDNPSIEDLPEALRDLLLTIIKPLFSANPHPSLAPSGRKAQYPPAQSVPFSKPLVLDDSDKPWKLIFDSLTSPLLNAIVNTYRELPPETLRPTIEQHLFLLTPALLNLIDDSSSTIKATGFTLLSHLSTTIHSTGSPILQTSGLTQVFTTAIRPSFAILPTLTPEPSALEIHSTLTPAYLNLLRASYPTLPASPTHPTPEFFNIANQNPTKSPSSSPTSEPARQAHLTLLLRHELLHGLLHLNAGTSTTTAPQLTTTLVAHLTPVLRNMGIYATVHLQRVAPLLRTILADPFVGAAPNLILAALDANAALVQICQVRVREKWWAEILRGVVAVWVTVADDVAVSGGVGGQKQLSGELRLVREKCRGVVRALGEVVEEADWEDARRRVVAEEEMLRDLFHAGTEKEG